MRVLAIISHPVRTSFSWAMLDAFTAGAIAAGHEVEVIDLHNHPFGIAIQPEDLTQFAGAAPPADVQIMQSRIEAAQALCFVYPIYWWTMPALLRGWIDRVFSLGWAYRISDDANKALLNDRPTVVLQTAGASAQTIEQFGYGPAMRRLMDDGLFRYCGLNALRGHTVYDVHESNGSREAGLSAARHLGQTLQTPGGVA
jgi:NAD(P)H dehydrogenase (quinone)